jgi:hypothetical protein
MQNGHRSVGAAADTGEACTAAMEASATIAVTKCIVRIERFVNLKVLLAL